VHFPDQQPKVGRTTTAHHRLRGFQGAFVWCVPQGKNATRSSVVAGKQGPVGGDPRILPSLAWGTPGKGDPLGGSREMPARAILDTLRTYLGGAIVLLR
jgi:hypothetical protein